MSQRKDEDRHIHGSHRSAASGPSSCLDMEMLSSRSDLQRSSWLAESVFSAAVPLSCSARQHEPHRASLTRVIDCERLPEGHRNLEEEQDAFCVRL